MPLFTNSILQARAAYDALEARTHSAEARAELLQAALDKSAVRPAAIAVETAQLRQRILNLEAENLRLRRQLDEVVKLAADLPLADFVRSIGMAVAVGEATMPGRAVSAVGATVQAYVIPSAEGVGLRFQQPELGALASGLSTTSFEIVNVPPASGAEAPRNLYAVLEDKQRVYASPFWKSTELANQLVAEIAKVFGNTAGWSFSYLLHSAATLAGLEKKLARSLSSTIPLESRETYEDAVDLLLGQTSSLLSKPSPVAGDLAALTAAMDATTRAVTGFAS
jgi:hypothetical protein